MKRAFTKILAAAVLVALMMGSVGAMAQGQGSAKIKLVNKGAIYYGDQVTLKAVVKLDGDYQLQWQVLEEGEWQDIKGETGKTMRFVVTQANQNTQYRVMVTAQ